MTSDLADITLVVISMVAPIFIFLVVIGPSRVVLLSLAVYAAFILSAVSITWILDRQTSTLDEDS